MNKYSYISYTSGHWESSWVGDILFEVEANSISEADLAAEKVLGKHPSKLPQVGCRIEWPEPLTPAE